MKKQILFLSALLALGFSGCSNEENIETGNSEEIRVAVTFDIGTETRTVDEDYLRQVVLYVFDENGNYVGAQTADNINGGHITFPQKGKYTVEAIANEYNAITGLTNYEDFKNRTTVYSNANTDRLQMRGMQIATVSNATPNPSMHFEMRRLVSRINIKNEVKDFVLTQAQLKGVMAQSYFYKGDDADMANYWNLTQTEDKVVTTFPTATDDTYYSVFYIYECPNDQCNLSLDIKGTIDGIEHAVPTLYKEAFIGTTAPLRRNTQYTVTLTEVDGAITATLEVSDWEEGEIITGAEVSPNGNSLEVEVSAAQTEGTGYLLATEAEREVKDLNLYLFNAEGTLEKACIGLEGAAWTPATMGDGKKVILKGILNAEAKTLYVVANAASTGATLNVEVGTTTLTAFESLMATTATGNLSCPLLMFKKVEIAADNWSEEGVAQASAVLKRAAARIDLRVNTASGFVPETVKLVGANAVSYIIAQNPAETKALTLECNNLVGAEEEGYRIYRQLFYTYSIASTQDMYLLLEGTQYIGEANSAKAIYKKPLSEMTGFEKIDHNTCYTITIDDVDGVPAIYGGDLSGDVDNKD
ncbi:MAG: FimB/Mfa2 family fimbrial subunit [Bacteroides sp.]|nr:FimB/Mfa2 family fimbrial subunit [Bacteroides sp.]